MEERRSGWLAPWILVPLVFLAAVLWTAASLPEVDCGGEGGKEGVDELVLLVLVAFAAVAAVAAALWRLVSMSLHDRYGSRDGWILLAALLILVAAAIVGAADDTVDGGLAIGGLVLPALAFLGLVVAAVERKRVEDVGILLPVYLFGAAYVYLAVGAIGFLASSGIGC